MTAHLTARAARSWRRLGATLEGAARREAFERDVAAKHAASFLAEVRGRRRGAASPPLPAPEGQLWDSLQMGLVLDRESPGSPYG